MESSPRLVGHAALASLLFPGLGQLYNGKLKKALVFSCCFFLLVFFFIGWADGNVLFQAIVLAIVVILYGLVLWDAIRDAKKQGTHYELKKYNGFISYGAFACFKIGGKYFVFLALGIRAFTIPGTSSYPTLKPGDHILVDTYAYINAAPNYGDMIAFKETLSGYDIIKTYRVVGLPRDRFYVKNNSAVINGKYMRAEFVAKLPKKDVMSISGGAAYGPKWEKETKLPEYHIYKEFYPNDFTHFSCRRMDLNSDVLKKNTEAIDIPSQHYFAMGDNRDNAHDSRFTGLIKKEVIIGKVKLESTSNSYLGSYQTLFFWSNDLSDYLN